MKQSHNYYQQQTEPVKETMLALHEIILQQDKDVTAAWKYGMPFFCFKGKMFCYLWVHKKYKQPYIGIVEGNRFSESFLIQEGRSKMKIMLIDTDKDIPVQRIKKLLQKALSFYRTGEIKIKS
jgi:Domain of unknown function (DU1801)